MSMSAGKRSVIITGPGFQDGNLITAPHYRNNGDFMRAVVSRFATS